MRSNKLDTFATWAAIGISSFLMLLLLIAFMRTIFAPLNHALMPH